ncbi:MAG: DUF4124 domain-containing protein [Steroidobacteraceae bacterium]
MRSLLVLSLVLLVPLTSFAASGEKSSTRTYRWVDNKGVVHYGDSVPPEYSHGQTSVLNSQGVELRQTAAQLGPEQRAAEQQRLEALARQKQHDSFLVTTYTSVKDIEQLRDERLSQLEGQVVASRGYLDSLGTRLNQLQQRAMMFKPYSDKAGAKRMPDQLAEEMVRAMNEQRSQTRVLESKRNEQALLRKQFQTDIDRYQELLAAHTRLNR